MSHSSKVFNKVPVEIQDKSGFDLSHENLFTAKVGTLTPCICEEVLPGDEFNINTTMQVKMPPMATDFYGRVDARLELFFVPNRILWAGWQDFITQDKNKRYYPGGSVDNPSATNPSGAPCRNVPSMAWTSATAAMVAPGTLADYFGFKSTTAPTTQGSINALPFLAYHKIWQDYYRDPNLQKPWFYDGLNTGGQLPSSSTGAAAPYFSGNMNIPVSSVGVNGTPIANMHQRCFSKDYYTTATYAPQAGADSELQFNVDLTTGDGSFSIASLRAANSLQKWLERNNLGSNRYYDNILAHFGVVPADAHVQRPILLGVQSYSVINNSVNQTAPSTAQSGTQNPFNSIGTEYAKSTCFGNGHLGTFKATEHGYIIGIFSLVPHAYYSTGTRRHLLRDVSSDFAFPEFANIGDQPIYKVEVSGGSDINTGTFGYNQRYSEYKYHDDEVHGLLKDGQNLKSFALQRSLGPTTVLGSQFLEIPTDYMDQVGAVTGDISRYGCMVDLYVNCQALRVLPEYSLPSL